MSYKTWFKKLSNKDITPQEGWDLLKELQNAENAMAGMQNELMASHAREENLKQISHRLYGVVQMGNLREGDEVLALGVHVAKWDFAKMGEPTYAFVPAVSLPDMRSQEILGPIKEVGDAGNIS